MSRPRNEVTFCQGWGLCSQLALAAEKGPGAYVPSSRLQQERALGLMFPARACSREGPWAGLVGGSTKTSSYDEL